jgi:hypothetical protein
MTRSFIPAVLALLLFMAAASPAPVAEPDLSKIEELELYGLPEGASLDDFAKAKRSGVPQLSSLKKRGLDQNALKQKLPGCSEDMDPSYATQPSKYQDGQGEQFISGMCDNGKYVGGWHCW